MKRTGLLILSTLLLQAGGVSLTAQTSSSAQQPVAKVVTAFDRPCIPADCVAIGSHTPRMLPHRALSGGRRNGLGARGTFTTGCKGKGQQEQHNEPGKKESTDRTQDDNSLRPYWKDGVRLETPDKRVSLKIGGRIQADWMWISEDQSVRDAIGDQTSGSEFRRTRLYMSGDLFGNLSFKSQFDFAGGSTALKDVFIGLKALPGVGNVKVGHYKEPYSLEELTSSNYMTFVERSLPNVFSSSRNVGLTVYNSQFDQRLTWAAGIFRDTDNGGTSLGDGVAGTFRLTGVPALSEQKDRLAHLGVSYSLRRPSDGALRWRQRPELHLTDRYLDTASFPSDQVQMLALEGAVVSGPFSVQSEYTYSAARSQIAGDPAFGGFYIYASVFLTGEQRNYKASSGSFDRVRPRKNFAPGEGTGAWEMALRYSTLDLTDRAIQGGRLTNLTAAVNWYLNPVARIMFNYVFGDLYEVGGTHAVVTRFQLNF